MLSTQTSITSETRPKKCPLGFILLTLMGAIGGNMIPLNAAPAKTSKQVALVNAGKPAATIYLAENPTTVATLAATELQEHVKKITGAVIPIAHESSSASTPAASGTRILIGESAATRRLGIDSKFFKTQEHLIRFLPNTVVLMGKDEPEVVLPEPARVPGKFGQAGGFDGNQRQFVSASGFNDEAGTFEGWVNLGETVGDASGIIFRLDSSNPWTYHILQQEPQSKRVGYHVYNDGKGSWSVNSAPLTDGWHFIQATHSAKDNKIELFVDGVSQGSDKYLATKCRDSKLEIGGSDGKAGKVSNAFRGRLDDLRISNVVRAPQLPIGALQEDANTTFLDSFDKRWRAKLSTKTLPLPELFGEKGTLDATYEFLEKFCGVQWYLPGEIGTTFSTTKTLRVGGAEIRRSPSMKWREIVDGPLYLETGGAEIPARDTALWKLRTRLGGEHYYANHSFYGYYDRFMKDHPDWFATTDRRQSPQLSYSNPEVVKQVVQDARDYFDGKGAHPGALATGRFFPLVPMDTDVWSASDRALFDKAEANNPQFGNGKASPVVWRFINNVAREVGKTNPDGYLSALSYWEYAYPPKDIVLEPNISVQVCLHVRNWWSPSMERNDRKILSDWVEQSKGKRPLFAWLYYCFPGLAAKSGKFIEFPGFFANTVVEQMKLYRAAGIRGIYMEHSSEFNRSFLLDQLEMYVTWRLADDPSLDGKKLINDFFKNYYGSAARPMQTMYEEMERTYSDPKNYPSSVRDSPAGNNQSEELAWKYLGTPARMTRWANLMAQAKKLAKTPVEKERLEIFERGVWKPMQDGAKRYRQDGPELERIKALPLPKVSVPIIADAAGDISKVNWEQALKAGPWSQLTGLPSKIDVEMKLAHDDKYLYVQLIDPRHGNTLASTPNIFSGDDWELFFAAQRAKPYHQFAMNPVNDSTSLRWADGGDEPKWESGAKSQSAVSAQGWTARLALPLEKLLPGGVKRGQPFFINAYRSAPNSTGLAWSPNFNESFHDLKRMVEVTLE